MKTAFRTIAKLAKLAAFTVILSIILTACLDSPGAKGTRIPISPDRKTISWQEFGRTISLSYDAGLATSAQAATVPAVLPSAEALFADAHPAYVQIRFRGFPADSTYQLPVISVGDNIPQVMIFQTAEFAGYGDDSPQGFVNQMKSLSEILKTGVDPKRCASPLQGYDSALPFLPWINMRQSFCAQPQIVEFNGGKGIRYLSYYAQDPAPVLDGRVFYTFQGLTDDGAFYISALFPVQTGIFPTLPLPCEACADPNYNPIPEWTALVGTQLTQLNALDAQDFAPSLMSLDEIVGSIRIEP